MGYRLPDHKPDMRRHIVDLSKQSVILVDNGTISRMSIPCFYREHRHHDRMLHDHLGWPRPDHPDASCQLPPGCECATIMRDLNLEDEGYTSVSVSFLNPPSGLTASGVIDVNMVYLTFNVMCPSITQENVDVPFSVYATGTRGAEYDDEQTIQLRDVVTKGILRIVAGPMS